ncbi:MAG: hypothetical protein JWO94_943 [Verrucomicrobiaceae bacterium]|nr:hypothetical protein [Verrucomicrobiaceae bacterium]
MIIFGTMALMNLVTAGLGQGMTSMPMASDNPLTVAMRESEGLKMFQKLLLLPVFLTGVLGVVAGIGVLKGSNGARKAGILWSTLYLLAGVADNAATMFYMRQAVAVMPMPPAVKPEMVESAKSQLMVSSLINAGFTTVFFIAMAVAVIVLLTRPPVVAFCTRKPFEKD